MFQYSVTYKYNDKIHTEKFLKLSDALDRWWLWERLDYKPSLHYIGEEPKFPISDILLEVVGL